MHEGHQPDLLGDLPDPDILPGERATEVDLATADADTPAARDRDRDRAILEGILEETYDLWDYFDEKRDALERLENYLLQLRDNERAGAAGKAKEVPRTRRRAPSGAAAPRNALPRTSGTSVAGR